MRHTLLMTNDQMQLWLHYLETSIFGKLVLLWIPDEFLWANYHLSSSSVDGEFQIVWIWPHGSSQMVEQQQLLLWDHGFSSFFIAWCRHTRQCSRTQKLQVIYFSWIMVYFLGWKNDYISKSVVFLIKEIIKEKHGIFPLLYVSFKAYTNQWN